jgi:hypothetical protein
VLQVWTSLLRSSARRKSLDCCWVASLEWCILYERSSDVCSRRKWSCRSNTPFQEQTLISFRF